MKNEEVEVVNETANEVVSDTVDSTQDVAFIHPSELGLQVRIQAFLKEYKEIANKWGVDIRPMHQFIDIFAIKDEKSSNEGV